MRPPIEGVRTAAERPGLTDRGEGQVRAMLEPLLAQAATPAPEIDVAADLAVRAPADLHAYLGAVRQLVLDEIRALVPRRRSPALYDLMLDYPLRDGKALRPALAIATCRALGGRLGDVLRSAAILELFHNAFLIHDDIEDGSELRRGRSTLHVAHGVPIAVNVGDGMLALTLEPLLDNARLLGVGKALRILSIMARMARESVEGQARELDWVRRNAWDLGDRDYLAMVYQKTCWYTFIAPILVGAIIGGADAETVTTLRRFAALLGVAFQIHDDVLNLVGDEAAIGKEHAGDLWEGKHTLILMHALRSATPRERESAVAILAKRRAEKSELEVAALAALVRRRGSVEHARAVAVSYAERSRRLLARAGARLQPSAHRDFIDQIAAYVIERDR
jgi:geranylgeranyl diphosphate synthase, type II